MKPQKLQKPQKLRKLKKASQPEVDELVKLFEANLEQLEARVTDELGQIHSKLNKIPASAKPSIETLETRVATLEASSHESGDYSADTSYKVRGHVKNLHKQTRARVSALEHQLTQGVQSGK